MPTILEFSDAATDEDYCGESLFKIIGGESSREMIFGQYEKERYASYMQVSKYFKYIYSAPNNNEFLFDLINDPEETRNKTFNPLYCKKTQELRDKILSYFQKEGYIQPLDGSGWRKYPKKETPEDLDAYLLFQKKMRAIGNRKIVYQIKKSQSINLYAF